MRTLLALFLLALSLMAANAQLAAKKLQFLNDYAQAITEGKETDKIVVLFIVKEPCSYCDTFVATTLASLNVQQRLQKFTPVIVDINDVYPKGYRPAMTPSTIFIDARSEDLVWESVGALKEKNFLTNLDEAVQSRDEDRRE